MNDRGAKALADVLEPHFGPSYFPHMTDVTIFGQDAEDVARKILGTTGLFIADVTKHEPDWEPDRDGDPLLCCSCGWDQTTGDGSFYDHIGATE